MTEQTIRAEKITKPIQLLGAWLAGLLSIDSCFLIAAYNMPLASFEARTLTVAAICNVPLFLIAVFLLQTRFRPEMQEDSYYSSYLDRKTNTPVVLSRESVHFAQINQKILEIEEHMRGQGQLANAEPQPLSVLAIGVNKHLVDRVNIGKRLAELGVIAVRSFGIEDIPVKRIVAISGYLTKDLTRNIVNVAKDLGFTHYTIFDNRMEDTDENVLFGSYGEAEFEIV